MSQDNQYAQPCTNSEAILLRFGFSEDIQKPAAGDDFRRFVGLRKMPRVAGHEVISLGCFGAFEKAVVGFVGGDGERLGCLYKVRNVVDAAKRVLNLRGFSFKRGRRKTSSYSAITGEEM